MGKQGGVWRAPKLIMPNRLVEGMNFEWISVDEIKMFPGICRDKDDTTNIILGSEVTLDITNSGANGLDTGSPTPNNHYAIHVIHDTSGINPVAGLFSLSETAPTLPTGYNKSRRVGWWRRTASNQFVKVFMVQEGSRKRYFFEAAITDGFVLLSGTATVYTTLSCAAVIPPTARECTLTFWWINITGAATDQANLRITGSGQVGTLIRTISPGFVTGVGGTYIENMDMLADASQQIDYKVSSAINNSLFIVVKEWIDEV